jgi:hypothetical protein
VHDDSLQKFDAFHLKYESKWLRKIVDGASLST